MLNEFCIDVYCDMQQEPIRVGPRVEALFLTAQTTVGMLRRAVAAKLRTNANAIRLEASVGAEGSPKVVLNDDKEPLGPAFDQRQYRCSLRIDKDAKVGNVNWEDDLPFTSGITDLRNGLGGNCTINQCVQCENPTLRFTEATHGKFHCCGKCGSLVCTDCIEARHSSIDARLLRDDATLCPVCLEHDLFAFSNNNNDVNSVQRTPYPSQNPLLVKTESKLACKLKRNPVCTERATKSLDTKPACRQHCEEYANSHKDAAAVDLSIAEFLRVHEANNNNNNNNKNCRMNPCKYCNTCSKSFCSHCDMAAHRVHDLDRLSDEQVRFLASQRWADYQGSLKRNHTAQLEDLARIQAIEEAKREMRKKMDREFDTAIKEIYRQRDEKLQVLEHMQIAINEMAHRNRFDVMQRLKELWDQFEREKDDELAKLRKDLQDRSEFKQELLVKFTQLNQLIRNAPELLFLSDSVTDFVSAFEAKTKIQGFQTHRWELHTQKVPQLFSFVGLNNVPTANNNTNNNDGGEQADGGAAAEEGEFQPLQFDVVVNHFDTESFHISSVVNLTLPSVTFNYKAWYERPSKQEQARFFARLLWGGANEASENDLEEAAKKATAKEMFQFLMGKSGAPDWDLYVNRCKKMTGNRNLTNQRVGNAELDQYFEKVPARYQQ